jgi:ribosomal protein L11 methyltransferase
MQWQQLTLQSSKEDIDSWSDALLEAGAVSITLEEDKNQPIYQSGTEEHPLWDHMSLIALFPLELDQKLIKLQLAQTIDQKIISQATWQNIAEEDWLLKWQQDLKPMLFGNKLWVCPSWCPIPDPAAINIILDPEMAFGTGTHPTTAMCLEWIAENIKVGNVIIDYGCGSGILAIAAAKMGATEVVGVDIDPVALEVSNNNALKNSIAPAVFRTYLNDHILNIKADIMIANILANPLLELAPTLAGLLKPGGKIVLSGLLTEQAATIELRYSQWFESFAVVQQGEWVRVTAVLK